MSWGACWGADPEPTPPKPHYEALLSNGCLAQASGQANGERMEARYRGMTFFTQYHQPTDRDPDKHEAYTSWLTGPVRDNRTRGTGWRGGVVIFKFRMLRCAISLKLPPLCCNLQYAKVITMADKNVPRIKIINIGACKRNHPSVQARSFPEATSNTECLGRRDRISLQPCDAGASIFGQRWDVLWVSSDPNI